MDHLFHEPLWQYLGDHSKAQNAAMELLLFVEDRTRQTKT
jgi:hypothetical protein